MAARPLRLLRWLLAPFGWLLLAALALAASAVYHLRLPLARELASGFISRIVTDEVRGELRIGRLERLSLDEVVARDVLLFDGEGRKVVHADRLALVPDTRGLARARIRFASARLDRGEVWLYDSGDGLPSLFTSFDSQVPSPGGGEPLRVLVDGIELARVAVRGELLGLSGIYAELASARGAMRIGGDVHVRIDSATGTLIEPYGFVAGIDDLSGTISTVADEGVDLRVRAHREREHASARIRYAAPKGAPGAEEIFRLEVNADGLSTPTLRAVGLDFIPELAVHISGDLALIGPFSDMALEAQVTTEAGSAHVLGILSDTEGARVSIRSERVLLARLLERAPELTLAGKVQITVPPDGSETKLALSLEPIVYDTWAVPGFELYGVLLPESVRIDSAAGRSRGARIDVRGEVGFQGSLDIRVRASFADIGTDANLKKLLPNARGRLDADASISSPDLGGRFLRYSGRVALRNLRYGVLEADSLSVQGSGRGDAERPALQLMLRGQQVRVSGYALGDPSLSLRGGPREYLAEGQFLSSGRRTFNASARIRAERDRFLVDADPIEFAVGEGSWRGAMQQLEIVPGQKVQLQLLRLASRSQRLEARGIVREHGEDDIEAQLQDFDLAAVYALLGERFPLQKGRADAQVRISEDLENPQVFLQGALRDGALFSLDGVNALYLINYRNGRVEADGEVDLGARGTVQVSGMGLVDPRLRDPLEALRRGTYDLQVSSPGLSLSVLPAAAAANIRCRLRGELTLRGTVDDPDISGTVAADPLNLPGWDTLRLRADGSYTSGLLAAKLAVADDRGSLGTVRGQLQLEWRELLAEPDALLRVLLGGPWQLEGETIERRLDRLPRPLVSYAPYPVALATQFTLQKEDGVTGGEVRFSGSVAELPLASECAQDVNVKLRGGLVLERGTSRIELAALQGVATVASFEASLETPVDRWLETGVIERPRLFRSSGHLAIEAIQRVPYLCEYGNGSIRADLELDGGLSAEPILVAIAEAKLYPRVVRQDRRRAVRVRSCEGDPIKATLELNADRELLKLRGGTSGCHGGKTALDVDLPVTWNSLLVLPTPDPQRQLSGEVRFNDAQLKPLLDRIPGVKNSDAMAHGEVKLSGTFADVRMSGELHLHDGRIYLVAMGQELSEIEAHLDFRGNWAKLEYLRARQGKGSLETTGGIGFTGPWPQRFKLALRTDELPVKREGVDMAWVTTSAAIDAAVDRERTRAVIKLHSMVLRLPDAINRSLQPLDPHPEVTVVTEAPKAKPPPYPIELSIDGQRRLTVRRNDFEATIETELQLSYRDPDLNVGGYVQFVGGEFEVFGKRFDINSGSLRFDGTTELNPDVLLAATQRPEAAGLSPVHVSVTGTLAEPDITFSSDVCPGENGAIAYLVSGRCTTDDADVAQESDDARTAVAAGLVSGVLTLGAQRELSDLLPRTSVESVGEGAVRVSAGISSDSIIPKFMRPLVRRVYIQGGVSTPSQSSGSTVQDQATSNNPLDFLIELYFPHSIVGSGRFADETWGVDITWEP